MDVQLPGGCVRIHRLGRRLAGKSSSNRRLTGDSAFRLSVDLHDGLSLVGAPNKSMLYSFARTGQAEWDTTNVQARRWLDPGCSPFVWLWSARCGGSSGDPYQGRQPLQAVFVADLCPPLCYAPTLTATAPCRSLTSFGVRERVQRWGDVALSAATRTASGTCSTSCVSWTRSNQGVRMTRGRHGMSRCYNSAWGTTWRDHQPGADPQSHSLHPGACHRQECQRVLGTPRVAFGSGHDY